MNDTIDTQETLIRRMEEEIRNHEITIQQQENIITDRDDNIQQLTKEIKQSKTQPSQQQDLTKLRKIESKLKEAEELNKLLLQKLDSAMTDQEDDEEEVVRTVIIENEKQNYLLVGDSNSREIYPHLENRHDNWDQLKDIFTIKELELRVRRDEIPTGYDAIILSQGTNDIRYDEDGYRMAKKMITTAQELSDKMPEVEIIVMDLPPLDDLSKNREVNLYNFTLATNKESIKIVEISAAMKEEEERKKEMKEEMKILREDGFHLTPEAGKIAANRLKEKIQGKKSSSATPREKETEKNETAETWYIPKKAGSAVIGRNGKTIREIQEKHRVSVHLDDAPINKDVQKITVKGEQQDVHRARSEIVEIVDNHGGTGQTAKARSKVECWYFQKGQCRNGSRCGYAHTTNPSDRRTSPHHRSATSNKSPHRSSPHEARRHSPPSHNTSHHRMSRRSSPRRSPLHREAPRHSTSTTTQNTRRTEETRRHREERTSHENRSRSPVHRKR